VVEDCAEGPANDVLHVLPLALAAGQVSQIDSNKVVLSVWRHGLDECRMNCDVELKSVAFRVLFDERTKEPTKSKQQNQTKNRFLVVFLQSS
jgi:hypothetical protein